MNILESLKRWTTVVADTGAMATEKLAEGIRKFYADARKLEQYAQTRVSQKAAV
jgi:transaldolase